MFHNVFLFSNASSAASNAYFNGRYLGTIDYETPEHGLSEYTCNTE